MAQKLTLNATQINQFVDHAQRSLNFHGTVLLVQGNDTILYKGYGYSNPKNKVLTDKTTAYNIASVTKGFTAVAILKLVEEGKLSLQHPLNIYFNDVPKNKATITIHQLLNHTSGIGQHYAADGEENQVKAVHNILKLPLTDSPGKRFIYSNDNYTLLAIIIERVTGETWESYIRRCILVPLAMNATFFQADYPQVAQAKIPRLDGTVPDRTKRDYGNTGATGLFSTAADLASFQRALSTNKLLTDQSKELLFGKYTKIASLWPETTSYYGYGLFVTETKNSPLERIWLRGNEDRWGTCATFWLPTIDATLIVLSTSLSLSNGSKPHLYISDGILKSILN